MKTRLYTIEHNETGRIHVVRASRESVALAHVARKTHSCIVTDADSALLHGRAGIEVEVAGEAQEVGSGD
jgi:hypothetical protein